MPATDLRNLIEKPRSMRDSFESLKLLSDYLEVTFSASIAFVSCRTGVDNQTIDYPFDALATRQAIDRTAAYAGTPAVDLVLVARGVPLIWSRGDLLQIDVTTLPENNGSNPNAHALPDLLLVPCARADTTAVCAIRASKSLRQAPAAIVGITSTIQQYLTAHFAAHPPTAKTRDRLLSPQEDRVMHHCCEGLTDKKTAIILGISPHTVRAHLNNAKDKLKARNKTHAAILYAKGRR